MNAYAVLVSILFPIALGYLCGSTPWGFLIAKFNGLDIRKHGSGNIGATNVRRVLGKDWGILCFVLDFLKGLVPVLVCGWICAGEPVGAEWAKILAAGATVGGHVYPVWLQFRGGKGVATTIGALIAVVPLSVVAALLTWLALFHLSRYVSLASLAAAVMLPISHLLLAAATDRFRVRTGSLLLLGALALLIIWRHRGNLSRLAQGTEYRFERKRKHKPKDSNGENSGSE